MSDVRYLQEEVAREKAAADLWRLRALKTREQANREIARLTEQVVQLSGQVMELAKRPPVIVQPQTVDTAGIISQIGETLAKTLGYTNQPEPSGVTITAKAMDDAGFTPSTGMQPGQTWYPEVEFDPWLGESPTSETDITASVNAQRPPPEGQTPVHQVQNGRVIRIDGQPLFSPGQGAPPPQGGVE